MMLKLFMLKFVIFDFSASMQLFCDQKNIIDLFFAISSIEVIMWKKVKRKCLWLFFYFQIGVIIFEKKHLSGMSIVAKVCLKCMTYFKFVLTFIDQNFAFYRLEISKINFTMQSQQTNKSYIIILRCNKDIHRKCIQTKADSWGNFWATLFNK
jgi:hypothetical protein